MSVWFGIFVGQHLWNIDLDTLSFQLDQSSVGCLGCNGRNFEIFEHERRLQSYESDLKLHF